MTTATEELEAAEPEPRESEKSTSGRMPLFLFVRGLIMLSVVVGLGGALHYYIGTRLIRDVALPSPWATVAWVALYALFFTLPMGFIASRTLPARVARPLEWVAFLWMGAFALLLVTVSAADLVFVFLRGADHLWWSRLEALVIVG